MLVEGTSRNKRFPQFRISNVLRFISVCTLFTDSPSYRCVSPEFLPSRSTAKIVFSFSLFHACYMLSRSLSAPGRLCECMSTLCTIWKGPSAQYNCYDSTSPLPHRSTPYHNVWVANKATLAYNEGPLVCASTHALTTCVPNTTEQRFDSQRNKQTYRVCCTERAIIHLHALVWSS